MNRLYLHVASPGWHAWICALTKLGVERNVGRTTQERKRNSTQLMSLPSVTIEVVAAMATTFLFGLVLASTVEYFKAFHDRLVVRIIVGVSFVANCIQTGAVIAALCKSLSVVQLSGRTEETLNTASKVAISVTPVIVLIAKILYTERCYWYAINRPTL